MTEGIVAKMERLLNTDIVAVCLQFISAYQKPHIVLFLIKTYRISVSTVLLSSYTDEEIEVQRFKLSCLRPYSLMSRDIWTQMRCSLSF